MTTEPPPIDMNALLREQRTRPRWDPFATPETDPQLDTETPNPKDAA